MEFDRLNSWLCLVGMCKRLKKAQQMSATKCSTSVMYL